jgi:hypothetical protein
MAVAVARLPAVIGEQAPRVRCVPDQRLKSRGVEAIEVAARAGLDLDPWQRDVLIESLRVEDGKWATFEVGVCVGRQNGKGSILEARELAGLFAFGERLIIHSAQQFDTSKEAFNRLLWLIEETPEFDSQLKKVSHSHGEEGITLKSGQRIRYRTRGKSGGRGFTADLVVLDEAMFVATFSHAALLPTLSAVANPQIWYTGSAVDQLVMDHGLVFSRVRERGLSGGDHSLAYFEWSLPFDSPGDVPDEVMRSEEARRQANPAYGIRINEDYLDSEYDALDPRALAVERFGVGDWPDSSGLAFSPISAEAWARLRDPASVIGETFVAAFDVSPVRVTALAVAGPREDGLLSVEIVEHRAGTGWLADALVKLSEKNPVEIVCDGYGPAASVVADLADAGVTVRTTNTAEHSQACGRLLDLVDEDRVRHLGSLELLQAVRGARTRPLGDAWAWSRKTSSVDISPLVAATLALSAASELPVDGDTLVIY